MTSLKAKIALALTIMTLTAAFTLIQAVDYNAGVQGYAAPLQWIQYGNFTSTGSNVSVNLTRTRWLTMGMVHANLTNIAMAMNGRLQNPTANLNETRILYNLQTGASNMSANQYGHIYNFTFIIAANLTANDPVTEGSAIRINATETRAYNGEDETPVNRTVNILNFTEATYSNVTVYDQTTGLLLEVNMTWAGGYTRFIATRARFRVIYAVPGVEGVRSGYPPVQWVKYENFNTTGVTESLRNFSRTIWLELEVGAVTGTNVTLDMVGEVYNTTARNTTESLDATRISNNLLTGATNMSLNPYASVYGFTYIIASNLTTNDIIVNGSRYKINSTEIRTYLDHNNNPLNRTVNILNITTYIPSMDTTYANVTVYDQITGLLLELNQTGPDGQISFNSTKARFDPRMVDDPMRFLYYAAIIITIVVVVAVIIFKRRKGGYVEVSPEEVSTQG